MKPNHSAIKLMSPGSFLQPQTRLFEVSTKFFLDLHVKKKHVNPKMDNKEEGLWSANVSDFYVVEFMGRSC